MKSVYIITNTSRAYNYGIGTYVNELIEILKNSSIQVHVVNLYVAGQAESSIEKMDGVRYIKIASPRSGNVPDSKNLMYYYRNVYYFLLPYIDEEEELIFHFNYMQGESLANMLKSKFKCKILLTVHYMDWSFALLGDVEKLKGIVNDTGGEKDRYIKESFERECKFISENFDHILAIANHSYETLRSIYNISPSRMTIVANGLRDQYIELTEEEKKEIRESFYFKENETLLIFAGRLDEVKGVGYLLKALNAVLEKNDNLRLIIAGDGDYKKCFEDSYPYWSKVVHTGFISKDKLYKLYSIADIGIIPSLHEEFGYVAIEMMMNGLPIIVNRTTGLSEIVKDGVNGNQIFIDQDVLQIDKSIQAFSDKIEELIQNKQLREKCIQQGRACFKLKYDYSLFKKNMLLLYDVLFSNINEM